MTTLAELRDPDRPPPPKWLGRFTYCGICGVTTGNYNAPHTSDCAALNDPPAPPECSGEVANDLP